MIKSLFEKTKSLFQAGVRDKIFSIDGYARQLGVKPRWFHKLPLIGSHLLARDISRAFAAKANAIFDKYKK